MAPAGDLVARDYARCRYGYTWNGSYCSRNNWSYWGRWVLAGICIFVFLTFLLCCLTMSRRRRRRGVKPMYGTGWMAGGPNNKWGQNNQNTHQMNNYGNPNQQQYGYGPPPPPPAYGQQQQPQYTGTTFNTNDGYYG
ncbi:hypothetical protein FZEAL_10586, partial [Fusarium zealandicum]